MTYSLKGLSSYFIHKYVHMSTMNTHPCNKHAYAHIAMVSVRLSLLHPTPVNSLPARSADPEEVAPKKDKASRGLFATFPYKRISSVRLCIHQGHSNGTFGRESCIKLIIERD